MSDFSKATPNWYVFNDGESCPEIRRDGEVTWECIATVHFGNNPGFRPTNDQRRIAEARAALIAEAVNSYDSLKSEVADLKAQRDELLEALERLTFAVESNISAVSVRVHQARKHARSALDKARGER